MVHDPRFRAASVSLPGPDRVSGPGVTVAMVQVPGAPVELMQIDHELRPDL
jgi:hypothetical protein